MWFKNLLLINPRLKKKIQIIGATLLVLIIFGGGYYLATRGSLSKVNLSGLISTLQREEEKAPAPESPEIILEVQTPQPQEQKPEPSSLEVFEEVAQKGDGITHLARRALKRYLEERGGTIKLSQGQKLFVEDYLQKKTGSYWLFLGEKISFSQELIEEAIEHAQKLTQEQIAHLDQLAQSVPGLNY